ncbi:MAG TPA: hypothetical protein PKA98_18355 [Acidimicrobiales bacterium]|nr:hypothetical protein [Acidimicrobiales bacterium]
MSRILERESEPVDVAAEEASVGRTTARAIAAAVALLIVSILVVTRSRAAFTTEGTGADVEFAAGTVQLTDDDYGSSLFAVQDMVPDRPERDCIVVSYDGNVLPVDVILSSEARGDLADLLQVVVERGAGGAFQDCTGFTPEATVFDGTLSALATADGVEAFRVEDSPAAQTFRFTFTLLGLPGDDGPPTPAGDDVAPPSAEARFIWEAEPTDEGDEN